MMYCLQCRVKTDTLDVVISISQNNRHMKRGKCVECGTMKCSFCKKPDDIDNIKPVEIIDIKAEMDDNIFPADDDNKKLPMDDASSE